MLYYLKFWQTWLTYLVELLRGANTVAGMMLPPALCNSITKSSFGTVYHAKWRGSDVVVKVLKEQDFHAKHFKEFLEEVYIEMYFFGAILDNIGS
ncbi:serine/threonine-protein kinase EDR1-like isoform X3 [Humulus lupulus]|uniref:serine/threonine-protein kinase EDR1-like isoform X3 n=1 Tax=Humulus lupulus TaxID=3486 RepID=UPI002B410E5C|nr:serine/threonine-protein kinase EDR1-like isoform X3 [Humulus lupulus]